MSQNKEAFLDILLKQSARTGYVLARIYCNGGWHQISGQDFSAHLGRAAQYWQDALNLNSSSDHFTKQQSVMIIGKNTYHSFITTLGAILCGLDVMCMPTQMSKSDIKWFLDQFNGLAIATDIEEVADHLKELPYPVFNVASTAWIPSDTHAEPPILTDYRKYRMSIEENRESKIKFEKNIGRFCFVTFGHDGFQKAEFLNPNALVLTANRFLLQAKIPKQIFWKSMELMPPSNPFAHLSRFCILLKNGILGFPNSTTDWETNLHILRPSFIFASLSEMNNLCSFIDDMKNRKPHQKNLNLSSKIDAVNDLLSSSRAMKLPESAFDFVKRTLRFSSRLLTGKLFLQQAVGDLRFVVHGLAPATELHVKTLEKLGIPVLETYGTTSSAGMLSCNEYASPHFNTIGNPLAHVKFRLGDQSTLEYFLSHPIFEKNRVWEETGDVAQMTPFGIVITGRKRHLFVTLGGAIVSPVRLEKLLKEFDSIEQACVIGDKMPYLSALVVLNQEAYADYKKENQIAKEKIAQIIAKVNETLPRNVTIKKFKILEKPFSEKNGEKLSNGEINRIKIQQSRKLEIESLYQ